VADEDSLREPGSVLPFTLLEGCLDEPLLLTRDRDGRLHGLSNVCTHRANLLADAPCRVDVLRCRYHGRRFKLDGTFLSMPEFEGASDFPRPTDSLAPFQVARWGKLLFASLEPEAPLEALLAPFSARLGWLPLDRAVLEAATSRDYEVKASWILYCDNYLEGFHIPYLHAGLNEAVDYGQYRTELFDHAVLQVGVGAEGTDVFDLPPTSPDHGQRIAAYYLWLFPGTMLNFYPWGLSVNVVRPLTPDRTRVSFLSYPWDPSRRARGAGADLHRVELEDEEVVERVQRGVRSRLYPGGRYSPSRETGVHHFHRMLARALSG
jgi:choline monooxygenase